MQNGQEVHLAVHWWGELWRAFERRLSFFFFFLSTSTPALKRARSTSHTTARVRRRVPLCRLVVTAEFSLRNLSASCVILVFCVSIFGETKGYFFDRFP